MSTPRNTRGGVLQPPTRGAQRARTLAAFERLEEQNPRAAEAVLLILEIVGEIDRARGMRLIEAVSLLMSTATRPPDRTVRR